MSINLDTVLTVERVFEQGSITIAEAYQRLLRYALLSPAATQHLLRIQNKEILAELKAGIAEICESGESSLFLERELIAINHVDRIRLRNWLDRAIET